MSLRFPAAVLLALGSTACGSGGPAWIDLARADRLVREGEPAALDTLEREGVRLVPDGENAWLEVEVPREQWTYRARLDYWHAHVGARASGRPPDGTPPVAFRSPTSGFEPYEGEALDAYQNAPPGSFAYRNGALVLRLAPGDEPPARGTLRLFFGRHTLENGACRYRGARFAGDAVVLLSGERASLRLDLPPASTLRFATVTERLVPPSWSADPAVTFSVELDGEPLYEHSQDVPPKGAVDWHAVPLPAEGRAGARLAFSVGGLTSASLFLAPSVGPAEVGAPGARPWDARSPNLVLFLADTFRADNLALYGGVGATPFLDRLAGEGLAFTRAFSTGTYTLPGHASAFAGVWPRQAGIRGQERALPTALVTIAEHLAAAGWRTGAVTDGGLVTQDFQLDQGFAYFDALPGTLEDTFRRADAFLDADDGRPVFLFVQSYRTHTPYHTTPEVLVTHGPPEDVSDGYHQLDSVMKLEAEEGRPVDPRRMAELREVYRAGAAALDAGFARFHADLGERGLLRSGYLLFTSDHGEAFAEHDVLYHGGRAWNELLRIPLLLLGPGLEARRVPFAASLVDVPPTLADLAGLAPEEAWVGRSLLELDAERPLLATDCGPRPGRTWAVIEGEKKVFGEADPGRLTELRAAYDLERDAGEEEDVLATSAWPRELAERHAALVRRGLESLVPVEDVALDPDQAGALRALGYVEVE